MAGLAKKVVMWVVSLIVMYAILVGTLGDIVTYSDNLSNDATLPTIIGTIAEFWWIGVVLLIIGVVTSTRQGRRAYRGFRRRFRRRR